MTLRYCNKHQRLFAVGQNRWIAFPSEIITRITDLFQCFPLPNFEVVEAMCDQCEEIV